MTSPSKDTPPDPIQATLALFEGPLAQVQFPDLDRETLANSAAQVEQLRADLSAALETVQTARTNLDAGQAALLEQVRRAHAYATIYAQGNADLTATLAGIKLDTRKLAPKKKRGRPRKDPKSQTSLSVAEDAA